ncbi:PQQ-binding-like beta-propeller repeat protein [Glycomyces harbinensis]|uniref:outer membrane protein assembly factor BamB family protein n=1 Tax=Glycomyces harbinensis TaxID=58114 RepID=UPI000B881EE8|nr:PQQ-binding-like beta-propeller repeat protein [Glycomyces harbinensis]
MSTFIDEGDPYREPEPDESSPVETEPSPVIESDLEITVIEEDAAAQAFALPATPKLDVDESAISGGLIEVVRDAALAGDNLIVSGGTDSFDHFVVLDIATGEVKWQQHGEDVLPGADVEVWAPGLDAKFAPPSVMQGPDGWLVLVPYTGLNFRVAGETSESGVAALSAEDGSVQWTAPLFEYNPDHETNQILNGIAVSGGTVVADVGVVRTDNTAAPLPEAAFADFRTVALDAADGSMLWEAPGTSVFNVLGSLEVAGGMVYAADAEQMVLGAPSEIVGLDLATGTGLWTFAEEDRYVRVETAVAGAAMLHLSSNPEWTHPAEQSVLLDAATGETLASVDTQVDCVNDGITRMACTFADLGGSEPVVQLFTFDAADPGIGIAADPLPSSVRWPTALLSGWIVIQDEDTRNLVVDAAGKGVSSAKQFGVPVTASEAYAVVAGRADGAILDDLNLYAIE